MGNPVQVSPPKPPFLTPWKFLFLLIVGFAGKAHICGLTYNVFAEKNSMLSCKIFILHGVFHRKLPFFLVIEFMEKNKSQVDAERFFVLSLYE